VSAEAAERPRSGSNAKDTKAEHDPPANVLIVDDEPHNRLLAETILTKEGYTFQIAVTGEEALAIVARQPPDLVLLDIVMPGMGGYEVAKRLKANPATRSIPLIIVSALEDREARMLALSAGAEDFLARPVDASELRVRVRNLLRLKACSDYHERYVERLEMEVGLRTADLAASERLYRSTFDAAPLGIAHVSLDGRWQRVNQHLGDMLGYSPHELLGSTVQDQVRSEEQGGDAEILRKMASGALSRHVVDERRYRRRDGRFVWVRVNMSVHREADGRAQFFIVVFEDITERRALEARVRQANKMDAVGQLASGIAHDFNNLLSVILSYGELLTADLKEGDPMRDELEEIRAAGLRAAALTKQLLAFSRQQPLAPRIVNLGEVIAGMEKMLRRLIGEDIVLTAIVGHTGQIMVDSGQMEQVIMNLVVNARDALPQGGHLTIETGDVVLDDAYAREHAEVTPGPHVMLAVSDTGVGMDTVTQARIFEPFFTTKEAGKGTGLGLATVFGIVRQSGGTIWLYSEPGVGTTFKVYFPRAEGLQLARAPSAPPDVRSLRGTETILLVEDEEQVRVLVAAILRRYGYHVLDAQSGGDAFLLCEQHGATIHLLLTDVVMPRMSGRQLAERLLVVRPEMKVVYMSGYTNDAVVRHGILNSTIAFVQKPITPEALVRKVRDTLDSVRAR